jgi:hypothetical protein
MADKDATKEFLDSLPEIGVDEAFHFACNPEVPCFNACCGDLNLMLTPYDALRLRSLLGEAGETFLSTRTESAVSPDTGFPQVLLRMMEGPGAPCPFVRPEGCSVYPDRPSACRTYPLGRATRPDEDGKIKERFFVVKEPHCRGFEEKQEMTPTLWFTDQGLEEYSRLNDRYMLLMARQKALGRPVDPRRTALLFLALYQTDRFKEFLENMKVLDKLDLSEEERERILSDEAYRLEFGMDWLELVLFGENDRLKVKQDAFK